MLDRCAEPVGESVVGPAAGQPDRRPRHSYREILRSSATIGGSALANVLIGMVRTKVLSLLLGPAGYGLMGAYALIVETTRSVAQMGVNSSGVRQIADAVASGDEERISVTMAVLRRISMLCAVLGAAALALCAGPISSLTFGSDRYADTIAWLSVAVFLSVVAGGQSALLQGMRRIGELAKMTVLGGIAGLVASVALVHLLGEDGLAPMLIAVAACTVFLSWWYARRVRIRTPLSGQHDLRDEAAALLKLGLAFMASGLLMTAAAYAVRIIVVRKSGLDAAGIYHAAWTLGGLYLGFVLQALGTDFYPRLVGVARDHDECNRLVNEQAQVSLLLAAPGVLATLSLAPLVIPIFYSAQFLEAVDVLRWICLGMAMRVLTWPIGFIVVAKNKQLLFFAIELAWTVVNVSLTWFLVDSFGANGAGMAFFLSYVFHALLVYPAVRVLSGFRWSATNRWTAFWCFGAIAAVFIGVKLLPPAPGMAFGALVTLASTYASVRALVRLASPERLPPALRRVLRLQAP